MKHYSRLIGDQTTNFERKQEHREVTALVVLLGLPPLPSVRERAAIGWLDTPMAAQETSSFSLFLFHPVACLFPRSLAWALSAQRCRPKASVADRDMRMRRGRHVLGVGILISVFDLSRDAAVVDLSMLPSSRIGDE